MQLKRGKTRVNRATAGFGFSPDWLKKEKLFSQCFEHDVIFFRLPNKTLVFLGTKPLT